jgi:hypothetical protein
MTFADWLSDTAEKVRRDGVKGCRDALYELYLGAWRRFGQLYNYGDPIYQDDWDILIILDACRADLMKEVASEYQFVSADAKNSIASTSAEWMQKNFQAEVYADAVAETAYITGNPFTDEVCFDHLCPTCGHDRERVPSAACDECGSTDSPERVPDHGFALLEEVWQYDWDDDLGTIPPGPLTDRAIEVWRDEIADRMIVHYMQPHHPFIGSDIHTSLSPEGFGEMGRESVWNLLRRGEVSKQDVWHDYANNLEYVLKDVSRLLRNVNADCVVLTADHGNAMGEYGLYGHYQDVPLKAMKRVPWCETSATNIKKYEPETAEETNVGDVEKRLRDLGYM